MSSSAGSDRVVGESAGWAAEAVVERDGGGEREEACSDAGAEAVQGAGAVAFEGEQAFAGLEDRLDPLADRGEMRPTRGFVFAAGPNDRGVKAGGGVLEVAAGVAFVADHEQVPVALTAFQQGEADVALGGFRGREQECPRSAVQGEQAVQAEAPEVAAVAGAVAVVGRVS